MLEVNKVYLITVFVNGTSYIDAAYIDKSKAEKQSLKILNEYTSEKIIASVRIENINLIGKLQDFGGNQECQYKKN